VGAALALRCGPAGRRHACMCASMQRRFAPVSQLSSSSHWAGHAPFAEGARTRGTRGLPPPLEQRGTAKSVLGHWGGGRYRGARGPPLCERGLSCRALPPQRYRRPADARGRDPRGGMDAETERRCRGTHASRVCACARTRSPLLDQEKHLRICVYACVCVCVCVCACMHAHVLVQGGSASGSLINAVEPGSIEELVTNVERTVGPIHTAVYNLGAQVRDCQMCTGQRT
jgi:hypothetical protein